MSPRRRGFRAFVPVLFVLAGVSLPARSAPDEQLLRHWKTMLESFQAGDPEAAFLEAKAAFVRAQSLPELSFDYRVEAASNYGFLALQLGVEVESAAAALQPVVAAFESDGLTADPRYTASGLLLAKVLLTLGRERQADELARRLELAALAPVDTKSEERVLALASLASFVSERGRPLDAARLARQVAESPVEVPDYLAAGLVMSLGNAAYTASEEGRTADYVLLADASLSLAERFLAPEHPLMAGALWRVHHARMAAGDHEGAIAPLEKLLASGDLGSSEKDYVDAMASTMTEYAHASFFKTRPDLQLGSARLAVTFARAVGDPADPRLGRALRQLSWAYGALGRTAESDDALQEAIEIFEQTSEGRQELVLVIDDLAISSWLAGRYEEAEKLFERVEGLTASLLGTEREIAPVDTAIFGLNRASLYVDVGQPDRALDELDASLGLMEEERGRRSLKWNDETLVAKILEKKAHALSLAGELEEALETSAQAIARAEEFYPETHVELAMRWANRADLLSGPAISDEMLEALERAVAVYEQTGIDSLPELAESRFRLAVSRLARGDLARGRPELSRAAEVFLAPANREHLGAARSALLIKAWSDLRFDPKGGLESAFETLQWTQQAVSAEAVRAVAARLAQKDPIAAGILRARQDARAGVDRVRGELVSALAEPEPDSERLTALRRELRGHEEAAEQAGVELRELGVDLAGVGETTPVALARIQGLLGDDEVLVTFGLPGLNPDVVEATAGSANFVIAMTGDDVGWGWIPEGRTQRLAERAEDLRRSIQYGETPALADGVENPRRGVTALASEALVAPMRDLYRTLFGPVEQIVSSRTHLIVVPPTELLGVPFHALLTDGEGTADNPRTAPWLIRRQAVSLMPSIGSFVALRTASPRSKETPSSTFLGIGDPVLAGAAPIDCETGLLSTRRSAPADIDYYVSGSGGPPVANLEALRMLRALPDARCELQAIAAGFGEATSDLLLGKDAAETRVKALSASGELAGYDVVAFATHGLVAGEAGSREPALVLTPPTVASAADDGLLAASEIATLRFDADLVVLSACNTAAGSGKGAEGLSGLARAFFYAGGRTLLVSHWSVYSSAAVALTTAMFEARRADPSIANAEALRGAMLAVLDDPASTPAMLRPSYWAPFSIVGEAGRRTVGANP